VLDRFSLWQCWQGDPAQVLLVVLSNLLFRRMNFTEPAELEDKVVLMRSSAALSAIAAQQTTFASASGSNILGRRSSSRSSRGSQVGNDRVRKLSRSSSSRSRAEQVAEAARATVFAGDATVVRLFASSPPESEFIGLGDDEDEEDDGGAQQEAADGHIVHSWFARTKENKRAAQLKENLRRPIAGDSGSAGGEAKIDFSSEAVEDDLQKGQQDIYGNARSGIARILGRAEKRGSGRPLGKAPAASQFGLVLYLPNQEPLKLQVSKKATVTQVIQQLTEYLRQSSKYVYRLHPDHNKYEIRLHEEDGLPDSDFPALDADMEIGNFCEGPWQELCVCLKPGEKIDSSVGQTENDAATFSAQAESAKKALEEKMIKLIKVYFAETGFQTSVQVKEGWRPTALLKKVQEKQRLPLFSDEFEFRIPEEEKADLGFSDSVVPSNTDLYNSKIRTLRLCRIDYADAPFKSNRFERLDSFHSDRDQNNSAAIHDGEVVAIPPKPSLKAYNPENFLFNDQTAAVYEQWEVIKTNKWSKKQRRILGIDYQKVYNKKPEKDDTKKMNMNVLGHNVKRAERLIDDVIRVQIFQQDPSTLFITWKDKDTSSQPFINENTIKYTVESGPREAARIVAKLNYIKETRGKG